MPVAANPQALRERVLAAVDRKFAEPIRVSFLKNGTADPARAVTEITAVLRVGGGEQSNVAGGSSEAWRTQIAAGKAELHIDASVYSGPTIKTKDRICALSRPGKPWWEVLRVDDRGETRLVLELGEV
ncbi:hypothetical protein [Terrihabitans rhizophilus]|uniref:Uncharacterized protein n=1 Tax=Terrihabitans rhizophilus TaxID=3092662 RepID=A0ABU4RNB4_9HYPH|nr:hypothetical protein [Terrihabitans sp. PJ23]MDX6806318.1 hypothetical protein [Terrihabitans sp. PJ23]